MMVETRGSLGTIAGAVAVAALIAAFALPGADAAVVPRACGLTTLEGSIRPTEAGKLRCGPGDPIQVRTDLARAGQSRSATRQGLLAFLALGDMHVTDEESPLRMEMADACATTETQGSFRPQEALLPQLANAHINAASALAQNGSPRLGKSYDFAVQLGDSADNRQRNETRWAIDLLDGGTIVNPDSGADGYEGTQARDPRGGDAFTSPVRDSSLRELANEPFAAQGLRGPGGSPLPWYAVIGSHDAKVQGALEDDATVSQLANAIATGTVKLSSLDPEVRAQICKDPSLASDPRFVQQLLADPTAATPKVVSADPDRRVLPRAEWISEHSTTRGLPLGHGLAGGRCNDGKGGALPRACYAWDHGPFRMVALDTAAPEQGEDGNIDAAQFAWLERELEAASSTFVDADGKRKKHAVADRLVIVFSHHTTEGLTNARPNAGVADGAALESLLLRFPNVILQVNGSTPRDRVVAHADDDNATSYWEVNAGSIADWPSRSRSIEIADNRDGTLSIFGLQFEAAADTDARTVSWREDDLTDERRMGADGGVNEDWLAAAAREIALNDPQAATETGSIKHRNVELLLKHPLGVTPTGGFQPPPPRPFPTLQPGFPGGFKFPSNFPPGFPGGLPPTPFPNQPSPGFNEPTFGGTQKGLAIDPSEDSVMTMRIVLLILAAAAGATWLVQARVKRWMIGI